jgi:hypothetical protein
VLLIHSETDWSFRLAAAVMAFKSSARNRTGTIRPLASPLASFGLPIFFGLVGFATVLELLHNGRFDGGLW